MMARNAFEHDQPAVRDEVAEAAISELCEALSEQINSGSSDISDAIDSLADAIRHAEVKVRVRVDFGMHWLAIALVLSAALLNDQW